MPSLKNIVLACLILAAPPVSATDAGDATTTLEHGAALFAGYCSGCHNEGGTGVPGLAPPLDRPEFWQALGDDAPTYLTGVVTKGFNMAITVRGERYRGMFMTPMSGVSDAELASINSWILGVLGETELQISSDFVAEIRASDLKNQDLKTMRPPTQ